MAENEIVSEDELEMAIGGYDDWCWYDYCCYVGFKQPEDCDRDDACFMQFECIIEYGTP
ncbi:MAG: hypothetical protein K5745_09230 [Saccharofermentans sp.]|nr:hypothetical protein [Saccharofermentans sp.]